MPKNSFEYHSFLLRLWRDDQSSPWRISLQNTSTGERKGFTSLDEAAAALAELVGHPKRVNFPPGLEADTNPGDPSSQV